MQTPGAAANLLKGECKMICTLGEKNRSYFCRPPKSCPGCGWEAEEHSRRMARIRARDLEKDAFGALRLVIHKKVTP